MWGTAMGEALVHIDGFRMDFGDTTVIRDLSFDVGAGETFGFLGSNGSGKTTTIRALLAIYQPTAGSLHINGKPFRPEDHPDRRQGPGPAPDRPGPDARFRLPEHHPVTALLRNGLGSLNTAEAAIVIGILFLGAALMFRLAVRLFQYGSISYTSKVNIRTALRTGANQS
jgi:ABC-type cobalamin/Fe3+-siderophores transport system ATPase subunit